MEPVVVHTELECVCGFRPAQRIGDLVSAVILNGGQEIAGAYCPYGGGDQAGEFGIGQARANFVAAAESQVIDHRGRKDGRVVCAPKVDTVDLDAFTRYGVGCESFNCATHRNRIVLFRTAAVVAECETAAVAKCIVASNHTSPSIVSFIERLFLALIEIVGGHLGCCGCVADERIENHLAWLDCVLLLVGNEEEQLIVLDRSSDATAPLLERFGGLHVDQSAGVCQVRHGNGTIRAERSIAVLVEALAMPKVRPALSDDI